MSRVHQTDRPPRAKVLATALFASALGLTSSAQAPVYHASANLSAFDVIVLDSQRRPVRGLTAEDFTVAVDGNVVPIATFVAVDRLTKTEAVQESAQGGESLGKIGNAPEGDYGRVIVIMLDRSIPNGEPTVRARSVAKAVVATADSGDFVGLSRSSGYANGGSTVEPTLDRRRLLRAIEEPFVGITTMPDMTFEGFVSRRPDLLQTGDCLCGGCTFEAIENVALGLEREHDRRQKILVFIGSDIVVQLGPRQADECQAHVSRWRKRLLRALDRSNITMHSFDVRGLETLSRGADALPTSNQRSPPVGPHLARQGNMAVFPDFTGGRAVVNTNDPSAMVPDVLAETQAYYVLGIERHGAGSDEPPREVRIRVDKPGTTIRSRRYYFGSERR